MLSHPFAAQMVGVHAQKPVDDRNGILAVDQIESMINDVSERWRQASAGSYAPPHEPPAAQHHPRCTAQRGRYSAEPVIYRRPGDDLVDTAFPARGPDRPVATHRDTDYGRGLNSEVVEHGLDWLLPVVVERESFQGTSAALTWAFEGDHIEAGRGDVLPDRVELLDQRVEATVHEYRATTRRFGRTQ